jgi:hypothetical protein
MKQARRNRGARPARAWVRGPAARTARPALGRVWIDHLRTMLLVTLATSGRKP